MRIPRWTTLDNCTTLSNWSSLQQPESIRELNLHNAHLQRQLQNQFTCNNNIAFVAENTFGLKLKDERMTHVTYSWLTEAKNIDFVWNVTECNTTNENAAKIKLSSKWQRSKRHRCPVLFWLCNINLFSNTEFRPNEPICWN